ncbi:MAG: hypothetical protein ACNI27_13955 [Desulfovibrio sp.]
MIVESMQEKISSTEGGINHNGDMDLTTQKKPFDTPKGYKRWKAAVVQ